MSERYDGLALFSGGLDSILAVKMVEKQGLKILGLHFLSPFFGKRRLIEHWCEEYGVDIVPVDISKAYLNMMVDGPGNGFGKILNPCMDCKITMLNHARALLDEYGAKFIVSGEVVGQRPMSQRKDALAVISRDADVKGLLLRPLCAKKMDPTPAEESGLVDRDMLGDMWGRGRKGQLALAEEYGITEIPTPGGGCKLTEWESARRYFPLVVKYRSKRPADYTLADTGRQYWAGDHLVACGRNESSNKRLDRIALGSDLIFKVKEFPGALGVGRKFSEGEWTPDAVQAAAAHTASFSPKAKRIGREVTVLVTTRGQTSEVTVMPDRETPLGFAEPSVEALKTWRKELGRKEIEERRAAKKARQQNAKQTQQR